MHPLPHSCRSSPTGNIGLSILNITYNHKVVWSCVYHSECQRPNYIIFLFFFSSPSLLLPTRLPPPSCTHAQSCKPMDCFRQAPLSMDFSRQEYLSGLPFPSPYHISSFLHIGYNLECDGMVNNH